MSLTKRLGLFLTEYATMHFLSWRNKMNGKDEVLAWNGSTTGLASITNGGYTYYKVSGEMPTADLMVGRTMTCSSGGQEIEFDVAESDIVTGTGCYYDGENHSFIVCLQTNIVLNNRNRTVETGTYFVKANNLTCTKMTNRSNLTKIDDAFAALEDAVGQNSADLESAKAELAAQIDAVDAKVENASGITQEVSAKFEEINAKFEDVDARFEEVGDLISEANDAVDTVTDALGEHEQSTGHITTDERARWNAKESSGAAATVQSNLDNHEADAVAHITSGERNVWNSKENGGAAAAVQGSLDIHTGNGDIHVTAAQKTEWSGKATTASVDAVQTNLNTHTGNSGIHVTSEDKAKWDGKENAGAADAVQDNLDDHEADTSVHITASERAAWDAKQDALTFDSTPTSTSTNPVTSGGVYTALSTKQTAAQVKTAIQTALNRTTNVHAADTNYTTYMARGEALFSAETNPTVNGTIAWNYR